MSIISWIILGLIAGFIGSKIVNRQGQGLMLDIALGVVGAIVGGVLFSFFGATGITGLNLYSLLVAIVGSVVVLWAYHALAGRRRAEPGRIFPAHKAGAGEGNRTLVCSLGSCRSTIELRPRTRTIPNGLRTPQARSASGQVLKCFESFRLCA